MRVATEWCSRQGTDGPTRLCHLTGDAVGERGVALDHCRLIADESVKHLCHGGDSIPRRYVDTFLGPRFFRQLRAHADDTGVGLDNEHFLAVLKLLPLLLRGTSERQHEAP